MTDLSASVMIQMLPSPMVGTKDSVALAQGDLVLAAIERAQLCPISRRVAGKVCEGVLPRLREEI